MKFVTIIFFVNHFQVNKRKKKIMHMNVVFYFIWFWK